MSKLYNYFLLIVVAFYSTTAVAQKLERKGYLGIYPTAVTLDDVVQWNLKNTEGAKITQLAPDGTAAQLDLQINDIIVTINGQPIPTVQALYGVLQDIRKDDTVTFSINRQGKEITRKGKMAGRPLQEIAGGEVIYDAVPFKGGHLRAIVAKPSGAGRFPMVYFLQGYTCSSIEFQGANPLGRLVEQLVGMGYAVFRVEKPGVGDSQHTPDCLDIDFPTEVAAFEAAYEKMVSYDFVDKNQIFLYGHSLGGLVAPLLAQKFQPAGVMVYGTVVYSWEDYMIELYRMQFPMEGQDYATVEEKVKKGKSLLHEYYHEKKHPRDIGKTAAEKTLARELLSYDGEERCLDRHYTFWPSLNDINFVDAWKKTKSKVLAMYGEFDYAALDADAMEAIAKIVNHYHPGNGTFKLLPKTDHSLFLLESMEQGVELFNSGQLGQYGMAHFNEDYATVLHEWMQEVLKSS